jgi:putative chitinase
MPFERFLSCVLADELITDLRQRAYLLATVRHETANTWEPIEERYNGDKHEYFVQKYGSRADLGNLTAEDGFTYRGRGYVQITGRANYERLGERLGAGLLIYPERALDHAIAYQIASVGMAEGLFTGRAISRYVNADHADYYSARRVINGLDRADLVAKYAVEYQALLREIRRG